MSSGTSRRQQFRHRLVNVFSVSKNVLDRRPAEVAAVIAGRAFADRVVIAVEKETELLVEHLIAADEMLEDHLLKKPRRVGDVPFRRGNVDGRLRDVIFDLERLAELIPCRTNVLKRCSRSTAAASDFPIASIFKAYFRCFDRQN